MEHSLGNARTKLDSWSLFFPGSLLQGFDPDAALRVLYNVLCASGSIKETGVVRSLVICRQEMPLG